MIGFRKKNVNPKITVHDILLHLGVDPGAGGLQKTSDGKQKIIERIDCSGAGDVDMSREVTPNKDGIIEGMISLCNKVYANYLNVRYLFTVSSLHFVL